jgi:hypothetical protein
MRSFVFVCLAGALLGTATGCASAPIVQTNLPLKRVVVYRNGVAYFERGGFVNQDEVRFKMKQSEVGDFLATLAVMERGGSSVRSAAFPLKIDDENKDAKPSKMPPQTEDEKRGLKTVVLSLDGNAHELQVGYIAEAPVWRPSYRLVVQPNGEADLQAWGIVENLSGEDWQNVQLTLIAGAPIAFEAQLAKPIIPDRPIVTDMGEIIAAVPHAETSLAQGADKNAEQEGQGQPPPPPPAMAAPQSAGEATSDTTATKAEADDPNMPSGNARGMIVGGVAHASRSGGGGGAGAPAADADGVMPSQPRNLRSLASIAVQAGTTRYDIPGGITVPDKSASMVLLFATRVKGEAVYYFAPDDGIPDSATHPLRVARYKNGTAGLLERGPIAVFEAGSFLGQGLVDPLPAGASATVPFALERAIGLEKEVKNDELGARLSKIENGQLFIERDEVTTTKYKVNNGMRMNVKLIIRHQRIPGTRLFKPPQDTEDNIGTGAALVPGTFPAGTTSVIIDERAPSQQYADWFSIPADNAVQGYMSDPRADKDIVQKLAAAWQIRAQLIQIRDAQAKIDAERATLEAQSQDTRANLRSIEKNTGANAEALRKQLTDSLTTMSARLMELTNQTVANNMKQSELGIGFREAIKGITMTAPPAPNP